MKAEVAVTTSLSDSQIDQWSRVLTAQSHLPGSHRGLSVATSGAAWQPQSGIGGKQVTPKRRPTGTQALPPISSSSNRSGSATRKRKAPSDTDGPSDAQGTQFVRLPCYQMQTHARSVDGVQDQTIAARLVFILDTLLKNELSLAFASPVNVNDVPGYSTLIKNPMDLGTIKMRLQRGFYSGRFDQVPRDVDLVWQNCFTFNRLDAEISKCANRLRCKLIAFVSSCVRDGLSNDCWFIPAAIFNRMYEQWILDVPPNTPVNQLPSEEQCRRCRQTNATDSMLLCDSCDGAYHLFCLQPPLSAIPAGNWYCPRCPMQQFVAK